MTTEGSSFWTAFVPQGDHYQWRADILWLNVVSDAFIAAAYLIISAGLYLVLRRKPDTPYRTLIILFSLFILACGVTHLVSIWTVWHGHYGFWGIAKATTAAISIVTAIALILWLSKITTLKSSEELQFMNEQLQETVDTQEASKKKLQRMEERLRTFLQQAPDGILIVVKSGEIEYSNDMINAMFGLSSGELNGRYITELVPARSKDKIRTEHNNVFDVEKARSKSAGVEFTGVRKNGTEFPMEIRMSPIRSEHDDGDLMLATFRDITARKKKEERYRKAFMDLEHVSKLSTVGEMAAGLAHELNQPLTAISNNLHTAMIMQRKKASPDTELMEILQENYESAQRAAQIIRSLRQLVRKSDGSKQATNINDLIETTLKLIAPEARAANVKIQLDLDRNIPATTVMDSAQIQQVMVNLGRNAIEALAEQRSPSERIVTIKTVPHDSKTILVSVMDNGPGLTENVKANLFQPYVTRKESGTGLGLSICRSIVESQGGRLWHEDINQQGTLFCFTIPVFSGVEE